MKPDLAKHVQVELSSARVARLWERVEPRLATPGRQRPWLWRGVGVAAFGMAAALVVFAIYPKPYAPSVFQNAVLESQSDRFSVNLAEGSLLELAAQSRVVVQESASSSVRLRLERGSVECDVRHVPGRRFSVEASGVEVHVVGTRFRVTRLSQSTRVEVAVQRGVVEVRKPQPAAEVRRLSAGEVLAIDTSQSAGEREDATPASAAPELEPRASSDPETHASEGPAPAASGLEKTPALERATPPSPGHRELGRARDVAKAPPALDSASAAELLEFANSARRSADLAGAAKAYETLLVHYPSDPRSGLAAFELGRLRLDRLGNPRGAVQAFERAIALAPGAGFREDAMARLVDAYAALGDTERCSLARKKYLESYPQGVRAAAMLRKCGASSAPR